MAFAPKSCKYSTVPARIIKLLGLILALAFLGYRLFIYVPPPETFSGAKSVLENRIYADHPFTVYCNAEFDSDKRISPAEGFVASSYQSRASGMEWEHAVPAENFGRTFEEWRSGHPECERRGKPFKGRKCAALVSREFRKMEADMYNLFPAVGAVNAARGNRSYAELPDAPASFGSCNIKMAPNRFEPPDRAKGELARASLYMASQYQRFRLSHRQQQLFQAWDARFPVTRWECARAKRIERIQGNANIYVRTPCEAAGWY